MRWRQSDILFWVWYLEENGRADGDYVRLSVQAQDTMVNFVGKYSGLASIFDHTAILTYDLDQAKTYVFQFLERMKKLQVFL